MLLLTGLAELLCDGKKIMRVDDGRASCTTFYGCLESVVDISRSLSPQTSTSLCI